MSSSFETYSLVDSALEKDVNHLMPGQGYVQDVPICPTGNFVNAVLLS
jgi:hypothetical protein